MAIKISKAAAIAACDIITGLVDTGGTANALVIYDGSIPSTPETAITTQTALVTFALPDPSFIGAVDAGGGGRATLNSVTPVTSDDAGDATFFRIFGGDGTTVIIQGTVSDGAGVGDLKLPSVTIGTGVDVSITSLTLTLPAG